MGTVYGSEDRSLDHPYIGAIHSFEHSDDIHFLVLEWVEGETLAQRLTRIPLEAPGPRLRSLDEVHGHKEGKTSIL